MAEILTAFDNEFRYRRSPSLDLDDQVLDEATKAEFQQAIIDQQNELKELFEKQISSSSPLEGYDWALAPGAFKHVIEIRYQKAVLACLVGNSFESKNVTSTSNICVRSHPTGEVFDEALVIDQYKYILASTQFDRILSFTTKLLEDAVAICHERNWSPSNIDSTGNFVGGGSLSTLLNKDHEMAETITMRALIIYLSAVRYMRPPLLEVGIPGYRRWGIDTTRSAPSDEIFMKYSIRRTKNGQITRDFIIKDLARYFSIFHELGHLLFHDFSDTQRNDKEEMESDAWGIRFLKFHMAHGLTEFGRDFCHEEDRNIGYEPLTNQPYVAAGVYYGVLQTLNFFKMTQRFFEIESDPAEDLEMGNLANTREELERRFQLMKHSSILQRALDFSSNIQDNNVQDAISKQHELGRSHMEIMVLLDCCKSMLSEWMGWRGGVLAAEKSNWNVRRVDGQLAMFYQSKKDASP
ncbi:MAG TPA: hypothetical protein EYQ81_13860 [Sneathiellales bacterium]|nr:hypothetical protein [Sneathiellales bacterium]